MKSITFKDNVTASINIDFYRKPRFRRKLDEHLIQVLWEELEWKMPIQQGDIYEVYREES